MLISLHHITLEFGERCLVRDASWHVQTGEKIGLIGLNGAGKSTLLKVLAGEMEPQSGTIQRQRDVKIGFFHQELLSYESTASVREVAMSAFEEIWQCWHRMQELSERMAHDPREEWMQAYSEWLHRFETANGYQLKARAEEVLEGLGFRTDELDRPYAEFSGGWRMRVLLARLLLQQPQLLLLDEPTNHLDLPSINWLEQYLQQQKNTLIIASHDRRFLNRLVHKIVEIDGQQLLIYKGNYDAYTHQKQMRQEQQQRAYENQQAFIKQQQAFIDRFRAKASKAAQVQSVIKKLERLDRIIPPQDTTIAPHFHFHLAQQPGKLIMSGQHVSKRYADHVVLHETAFEILRGDKIALIGANGKGKSTFLRMLHGAIDYEGHITTGHHVIKAYYAQHQTASLNLSHTILQEIEQHAVDYTTQEIRNILGQFLFKGDDVLKPIQVLSGGEKARVALVKLLLSRANFLLLDEPTNHLDMPSVEALKQALIAFPGSYIIVSHDRYFLDGLVNKIWYIEDGQIKAWNSSIDEWLKQQYRISRASPSSAPPVSQEPVTASAEQRALRKQYQQQKRQFDKLEKQLNDVQTSMHALEQQLADPALYANQAQFLSVEKAYRELQARHEALQLQYETLFEQLLHLESTLNPEGYQT